MGIGDGGFGDLGIGPNPQSPNFIKNNNLFKKDK